MEERAEVCERMPGLVSIIMPVFNGRQFLADAIESVLAQDYQLFELIILDDGSTDGSYEYLTQKYNSDLKIKLIGPFKNVGPFKLRNIGIASAKGSYIAFLDADDLWGEGKLGTQIRYMKDHLNVGLSHTNVVKIDEGANEVGRFDVDKTQYTGRCFYEMLKLNGVCNSSVVVRWDVIQKVGTFDEAFRYRGDWDMWTRIAQHHDFGYVESVLTKYRLHSTNVSNNYLRLRPYAFGIWEKFYHDYCKNDPKGRKLLESTYTNLTYSFALMELVGRSYALARVDFLKVISRRPSKLGAWLGLAKSLIYPLVRK